MSGMVCVKSQSGGSGCRMLLPTWGRLASRPGRKWPPTQRWAIRGVKRLTDPTPRPTLVKKRGRAWADSKATIHSSFHSQWPSSSQSARLGPRGIFDSSVFRPPSPSSQQVSSTVISKSPPTPPFTCLLWLTCWETLVRDPWQVSPCMFKVNTTSWSTVLTSFPGWKTFTAY